MSRDWLTREEHLEMDRRQTIEVCAIAVEKWTVDEYLSNTSSKQALAAAIRKFKDA